jgi:hypothetical protein
MSHDTLHIETHIAFTPEQATALQDVGVWTRTSEPSCNYCDAPVSSVSDKFVAFGVVLNGEHEWLICMSCSAPLHHRQKL